MSCIELTSFTRIESNAWWNLRCCIVKQAHWITQYHLETPKALIIIASGGILVGPIFGDARINQRSSIWSLRDVTPRNVQETCVSMAYMVPRFCTLRFGYRFCEPCRVSYLRAVTFACVPRPLLPISSCVVNFLLHKGAVRLIIIHCVQGVLVLVCSRNAAILCFQLPNSLWLGLV